MWPSIALALRPKLVQDTVQFVAAWIAVVNVVRFNGNYGDGWRKFMVTRI